MKLFEGEIIIGKANDMAVLLYDCRMRGSDRENHDH